MDLAREQRIMQLLDAAMDVPDEHVAVFLDKQCGDDLDLRNQVMSRISISCGGLDFIEKGLYDEDLTPGSFVGPFRIVRTLGEGGMGSVFLAQQDYPITRSVSLKVLKKGLDSDELQQRFQSERQTLANLQHPHIAQLFDAGETEDKRPYFTMEYVQGTSIVDYCRQNHLSLYKRIDLFTKVCEAVACAHDRGIIHRDIKPGNILVNEKGTPKLLDFGIAKHTEATPYGVETATNSQCRFMTPDYASPEQATGIRVTRSSDIYSLGVLLFELLTERRPYYFKDRLPVTVHQVICEQEPPVPSKVVLEQSPHEGKTARYTQRERRSFYRTLRGDLDSIILKMLRKKPEERYLNVKALLEDLDHFAKGRPVTARRQQRFYNFQKMWHKNRRHLARAGLTAAMMAGSGVAVLQYAQKNVRIQQVPGEVRTSSAGLLQAFKHLFLGQPGEQPITSPETRPLWIAGNGPDGATTATPETPGLPVPSTSNQPKPGRDDVLSQDQIQTRHAGPTSFQYDPTGTAHNAQKALSHRDSTALQSGGVGAFAAPGEDSAMRMDYEAWALSSQGRYDEAESLYRQALDQAINEHGNQHTAVADIYMGLADVLGKKGMVHDSESALRAALAIRTQHDEQQAVAAAMDSLAQNLESQNRFEESDSLRWRALNNRYAYHGGNPEKLMPSMQSLASTYESQGRFTHAVGIYRHMLSLQNERGKVLPQTTAGIYDGLGRVHVKMNALVEAEDYYQTAMRLRLQAFGERNLATIASAERLAGLLEQQDKVEEAENLYRQALSWRTAAGGAQDPAAVATMSSLVGLLNRQGRTDEAEEFKDLQDQVTGDLQEVEHPEVIHWRQDLESQEDPDELEPDITQDPGLSGSIVNTGRVQGGASTNTDFVQNSAGVDGP
ncbi:serine/threonine-protein kinase [Acanthopleuribacter pedis]|uniref:Protein kinase n=1 Tax=Acanthopleuribacter pedis TaxID=442870 RepID=A0A8J7QLS1_9BACT|nr:serine/threonine-protein kinase [Acanthopleuribacter pedis]MBO1320305.1 protein kinase [Acanthopleuribacter pedis]